MQYKQVGDDFFIHIEKSEKIMDTLTRFCNENNIKNAKLSGIGAVKDTEIGAFDTIKKEYIKKQFIETLELVSFEGNVSL